MSGQFNWSAPALSRLVGRLPFGNSNVESHISLQGEVASSHPQFGARGRARRSSTDSTAAAARASRWPTSRGTTAACRRTDTRCGRSAGAVRAESRGDACLADERASLSGSAAITFKQSQIDPLTALIGTGYEPNEPVLWLSLLPMGQAGQFNRTTHQYDWTIRVGAVRATLPLDSRRAAVRRVSISSQASSSSSGRCSIRPFAGARRIGR